MWLHNPEYRLFVVCTEIRRILTICQTANNGVGQTSPCFIFQVFCNKVRVFETLNYLAAARRNLWANKHLFVCLYLEPGHF